MIFRILCYIVFIHSAYIIDDEYLGDEFEVLKLYSHV